MVCKFYLNKGFKKIKEQEGLCRGRPNQLWKTTTVISLREEHLWSGTEASGMRRFTPSHFPWRKRSSPGSWAHLTASGAVTSVVTRGHYYAITVRGNTGPSLILLSCCVCRDTDDQGLPGVHDVVFLAHDQHLTWACCTGCQSFRLCWKVLEIGESLKVFTFIFYSRG